MDEATDYLASTNSWKEGDRRKQFFLQDRIRWKHSSHFLTFIVIAILCSYFEYKVYIFTF
jgi:hypothetical protein